MINLEIGKTYIPRNKEVYESKNLPTEITIDSFDEEAFFPLFHSKEVPFGFFRNGDRYASHKSDYDLIEEVV